jgi:hypothetical protein
MEFEFEFIAKPNLRIVSDEQKNKLRESRVSVPLTFTATKNGSGFVVGTGFFDANNMLSNEFKMAKAGGKAYVFVVGKGLGTSLKESKRSETGGKSKRFSANKFENMLLEMGYLPEPIAEKTLVTEKGENIHTFAIGEKRHFDLIKTDIEYPGAVAVFEVAVFDKVKAEAELGDNDSEEVVDEIVEQTIDASQEADLSEEEED